MISASATDITLFTLAIDFGKMSTLGTLFSIRVVIWSSCCRPADSPRAQEMIKYADAVLDALEITQGPSHMEVFADSKSHRGHYFPAQVKCLFVQVMYTSTGPCLVEVGSRCQGGEGTWITIVEECIGV